MSVVMSVYNGEQFLPEALESVLSQEGSELEVVVVDDGSTDLTPDILASFAARDRRLTVRTQQNQGLAFGLNHGIAAARAPLIARLDADDVALPGRLGRQRRFLEAHERVAVVGGGVRFIDHDGRVFAEWQYPLTDAEIRAELPHTTPLAHSAVMLRKQHVDRVCGYRPLFTSALDVDLWLRLAERHELANVPDPVVSYRVHGGQMTVRQLERQTFESVAARHAAWVRAAGSADPLDDLEQIDRESLLRLGVSDEQITEEFVDSSLWLAKTMARAGYADAAESVFAEAAARAASNSGSTALLARVHRARARRFAEDRRWLRATVEAARAARAERSAARAARS